MPTFILGAGGHASVVFDAARLSQIDVHAFMDDKPSIHEIQDIEVIRYSKDFFKNVGEWNYIVGIGDNHIRQKKFKELADLNGSPITIFHPKSIQSEFSEIGVGSVVMAGAIINYGAKIGDNVIINSGSIIEHHCHIGNHAHICPGVHLAGNVRVGNSCMIGTGSSVIPNINIGDNCFVGAGSVVVKDLPSNCVCYGNPCQIRKHI